MLLDNDNNMVDGWLEVERSDETAYVNPLASSNSPLQDAVGLTPDTVGDSGSDWDEVNESLSSPEAAGVKRVGIDFDNGLIDVEDSNGTTQYVLAALGEEGSLSVVDENGNVSTSSRNLMPLKHQMAIVETVQDLGSRDVTQIDVGFDEDWTDLYDDVMRTGTYEALDGDVRFNGFDSTRGMDLYSSCVEGAESFFDQLDDIAEFYRDHESDYSPSHTEIDIDMPVRPERKSNNNEAGSGYKFKTRGTDKDGGLVVSNDYDEDADAVELEVMAFGDHNSDARLY